MDNAFIYDNGKPQPKLLNKILTKEDYNLLVISIAIGWEIEYETQRQIQKFNPEWKSQAEYLAYLWGNHKKVNPFFIRNLQIACDEKISSDNRIEFLNLKSLLAKFSKNQNQSRVNRNNNILLEFEKLKEHISQLPHSVSNFKEIDEAVEVLNRVLNGIIQDWKENNNYIFFKDGKWINQYLDIIADPTELLSPDQIELFENELGQTENQLRIFNSTRIEIEKQVSNIKINIQQNSSSLATTNPRSENAKLIPQQLKTKLTDTQRDLLYNLLIDDNFISGDTDRDGFIWAFGGENYKYTSFKITWLKNKQLLRELLEPLKHPDIIIKADFERIVPSIFIDSKGEAITLAKNKRILSQDSDRIAAILKKIATC